MTSNERIAIYKEIIRITYMILGAEKGIQKNALEIQLWRNHRLITESEYHYLRCYSRISLY